MRPPTTSGLKGKMKKMKVKSKVRAGKLGLNHNQTARGLRVKSSVKKVETQPQLG